MKAIILTCSQWDIARLAQQRPSSRRQDHAEYINENSCEILDLRAGGIGGYRQPAAAVDVHRFDRHPQWERAPETATLTRFDELNPDIYARIAARFIARVMHGGRGNARSTLIRRLPAELRNRAPTTGRVLLAVADSFGPEWGRGRGKRPLL